MSTFPCTYPEFKQVVGDYLLAIKTCTTIAELDQGLKCVQLHYLGVDWDVAGAASLMRIVTDLYIRAEVRILNKEPHHGNQAA